MRDFIKYAIAWFLIVVIVNFFTKQDTWTGFYYPNGVETTDNPVIQQWLKNKSACFDWIDSMIKWNDKEDYECGTNCKYETSFELWRCKDTYDSR